MTTIITTQIIADAIEAFRVMHLDHVFDKAGRAQEIADLWRECDSVAMEILDEGRDGLVDMEWRTAYACDGTEITVMNVYGATLYSIGGKMIDNYLDATEALACKLFELNR